MQISVLKRKTSSMKDFDKKEWKHHNYDHFGKDIIWDTHIYFIRASDQKDVVGTLELKVECGVGYVRTLLVDHSKLRRGTGKILMQKAENLTKLHGGHKLFLLTGKHWDSVKFYTALGFQITAELKNHYFHQDFIELSKFI